MEAVIMAGTHKDKARLINNKNKSFLLINNKPVISYVLSALEKSKYIDKIYILGPKKQLSKITSKHTIIEELPAEKENALDHVFLAMSKVKSKRALFITCDVPLITSGMINTFIEKSKNLNHDIIMSYVNNSLPSFNKFRKIGITQAGIAKFREAKLRVGNMAIASTSLKDKLNPELLEQYYDHRKINAGPRIIRLYNALYMLFALGFFKVLKFFLGLYHIDEAEAEVKKRFNVSFKVLTLPYPEIAFDIDWPEDYEVIKKYMESQKSL